ncbi:hypothetical protein Misp01_60280 [Microtetraspora sp. NBRC 13810]|nr:hypothetical protein Misp01_60280 [Microtetraspora sp. NBRC 13810]
MPAVAAPPPPPTLSTARIQLKGLTVAPADSMAGFKRDLFPHWDRVEGRCDTREIVLRRDGQDVVADNECRAVRGEWHSPYDGETWTDAADIDIDHMVPLAEAWRSGAADWSTQRRRTFANDLDTSQLWAVTDNVNQAKSDKDPGVWKPPQRSFHCTYARSWIEVKNEYGLSVDSAEKAALEEMLDRC